MSVVNLATPLRATYRNPLAKMVDQQISQRQALMADSLLDMATARVILGVSESTLNKLVRSGKLAVIRYSPRSHRRVRTSVLRAFMSDGADHE